MLRSPYLVLSLALASCAAPFDEASAKDEKTTAAPIPAPVLNATFEPASADCNGWIADGAESIRSVPPRSGTYACKLCADGSKDAISIARTVSGVAPGRYVLTAWTRKRPQNEAPSATTARIEAGPTIVRTGTTSVRDEWDRLDATIDVPEGESSVRVVIEAPAASAKECILVDDVTVARDVSF